FATEVPFEYAAGNPSVASRGASYGMPGVEVDGNDEFAVFRTADEAIRRARTGGGPTLLECKTYRTRPHAEGMGDYTYRTREEVEEWKTRCPILRFRQSLLKNGTARESELDAIDGEIQRQVEEAHRVAEQSPWPEPASATTHVHASGPPSPLAKPGVGVSTREISFSQATLEALTSEMARNPAIFVMGE